MFLIKTFLALNSPAKAAQPLFDIYYRLGPTLLNRPKNNFKVLQIFGWNIIKSILIGSVALCTFMWETTESAKYGMYDIPDSV